MYCFFNPLYALYLGEKEPSVKDVSIVLKTSDGFKVQWRLDSQNAITSVALKKTSNQMQIFSTKIPYSSTNEEKFGSLQPGESYLLTLEPIFGKISGESVSIQVDLETETPEIVSFNQSPNNIIVKIDLHGTCEYVVFEIATDRSTEENLADCSIAVFNFTFKNLKSGTRYNITVTSIRSQYRKSSSLTAWTEPATVELAEQHVIFNTFVTKMTFHCKGYGRAFHYSILNGSNDEIISDIVSFRRFIKVTFKSAHYGLEVKTWIEGHDGTNGSHAVFLIGTYALQNVVFYHNIDYIDFTHPLLLNYTYNGPLTDVLVSIQPDQEFGDVGTPRICQPGVIPCKLPYPEMGTHLNITLTPRNEGVNGTGI